MTESPATRGFGHLIQDAEKRCPVPFETPSQRGDRKPLDTFFCCRVGWCSRLKSGFTFSPATGGRTHREQ